MANQFASCSVDKLMYLGSCASYLSNGATPCHALSSLANTCTTCDKVCVDWRNDELCPVECPVGTTYKACAQKDAPTCTNDGNIVQMTAACDVPKTCRPNEITKTIAT